MDSWGYVLGGYGLVVAAVAAYVVGVHRRIRRVVRGGERHRGET